MVFDRCMSMTFIAPAMQGNPLVVMIDLNGIFAVRDTDFFADVAERDAVKVPVFTDHNVIVLLDFCFCVMADLLRRFG